MYKIGWHWWKFEVKEKNLENLETNMTLTNQYIQKGTLISGLYTFYEEK